VINTIVGGPLRTRIRRTAVLAAAAGLLAVLPSSLGVAQAATTKAPETTAKPAAPACYDGSLQAPNRDTGPIETATRVGQKLDISTPVHNLDPVARAGAEFNIVIDAARMNAHVPPTIWWRIDKDPWHLIAFTWHPGSGGADPVWQSPELGLGTFAAHQIRTVEISTSFSTGSTKGFYSGSEAFETAACEQVGSGIQGSSTFSYYYN
jgi:hypothetical protein